MSRDAALSKNIAGLIIAIAGPLLARYGIDEVELELAVASASALIGGALAFWGRQTATGPITHVIGVPLPQALIPAPPIVPPTIVEEVKSNDQAP